MSRDHHTTGLIGAGIAGSLSPALHEREAAHLGLRYDYRLLDGVDVGPLLATARERGFTGVNVTHPCKQRVLSFLDALSPDADALGAVNTVVFDGDRAVGHNTDCTGFAAGFERGLPGAALDDVVLLGAGGAGAAVAQALLGLGVRRLTIVDAEPERARGLAARLGDGAPRGGDDASRVGDPASLNGDDALLLRDDASPAGGRRRGAVTWAERVDVRGADGLVNATPIGMVGHPGAPIDLDELHPGLWVADVVYRPLETELLRRARDLGCRTLDGGGMVVFQAADSLELFTGRHPDRHRMLAHFQELVA
jgi:shikimate dehydrogenase